MLALQQQIEYALRDGIVSHEKHKHLISAPIQIGKKYNVNPYYFFKSPRAFLEETICNFLRNIRKISKEFNGALAIGKTNHADVFQMIASVLIKNKIETWYYTLHDLIMFTTLEYTNRQIFSNNFVVITDITKESLVEHGKQFVNFLNYCRGNNVFLILHVENTESFATFTDFWKNEILNTFFLLQ